MANEEASQLLAALNTDESFQARAYTASTGDTGGIVVERAGHVRGVWHHHGSEFFWAPAGSSSPTFRTASLQDAVTHTLTALG